jgi:NAD(P)-dependent dehydrogenase (short-subunit alcohol dehydrogenase family)
MGETETRLFANEGATVIVGDVLATEGERVAADIRRSGGVARYVDLDVRVEAQWQSLVKDVISEFGKLDVLVNNAGIQGGRAPVEGTTTEMWQAVMDVNGLGVLNGMKAVFPTMKAAGVGSIVNISSVSGILAASYPKRETTPNVAYYASKAAVRILTKMAATQFGQYGIRVNSVHPGFIQAPMSQDSMQDPERMQYFMSVIPIRRFGTPDDVAQGVLYLATDDSAFVSGIELVIDGGYLAKA